MDIIVSIIIVNYNVRNYLAHCLHALHFSLHNISSEIIVVDNASSDGDYQWIAEKYPHVKWLPLQENIGFAKANNYGLRYANGRYVLFLNPDTLVATPSISNCISFFDQHKDCGAVGVHMMDGSGHFLPESKRSVPTPTVSFFKLAGFSRIFPKSHLFGKYALTFLDSNTIYKVPILAGAFMMVRRALLEKTGCFDEQFFMYGEDIDLSFRLQNKTGFHNYYLGNTSILHFKGESSKQNIARHNQVFYEAMKIFVKKYYQGFGSWWMRVSLDGGRLLQSLSHKIKTPVSNILQPFPSSYFRMGDDITQKILQQKIIKRYPNAQTTATIEETDTVVFCIGNAYDYAAAFDFLQKNSGQKSFYWFYATSETIIGSNDKDQTGVVWSL